MKKQVALVGAYLSAIILANLLVAKFGTIVVIPVGFALVGLDITGRDHLHELWARNRWLKMAILIGTGSLLSWLLNMGAGRVAIASFVAFASAATLDTITYAVLRRRQYLIKVNGSNVISAFADSAIFLTVAFGAFLPLLVISQFAAKVVGGFLWSLLLHRRPTKKVVQLQ